MNILDLKLHALFGAFGLGNDVFVLVIDGVLDGLTILKLTDASFYLDLCLLALNSGGDMDTGCAVIVKIKMALACANEIYISVQTAIEGKVCHLGINSVVCGVVHNDNEQVFILKTACQVNAPGGITAVVMLKALAVEINICAGVSTTQLKIINLSIGQLSLGKSLCIVALAAIIVVVTVLSVNSVPAVGQIKNIPICGQACGNSFCALYKGPFCIKV